MNKIQTDEDEGYDSEEHQNQKLKLQSARYLEDDIEKFVQIDQEEYQLYQNEIESNIQLLKKPID